MPRIQLPWPKGGNSDELAFSNQPPETTPRGLNVRTLDGRTRRSRGAQRPGMRRFWTNTQAARIDRLAAISYNVPRIAYTLLTENSNGTTTPAVIASEWTRDEGVLGRAVKTDRDGNVYELTEDARVLVYNPDGVLLDAIEVPLRNDEVVRRALAVDEARRVYVAANATAPETAASRIFQWRRIVDPDDNEVIYYDLAWTLELDGWVRDVVATAGGLWVARLGSGGQTFEQITKYGALAGTAPLKEWDMPTPGPVREIAVSTRGNVYVSIGSNLARNASPGLGGLHTPNVRFTPHDLGYDAAALNPLTSGENRLHAWVDASTVTLPHGSSAWALHDRRYLATQQTDVQEGQIAGSSENPAQYNDGPNDDTVRRMIRPGGPDSRPGPAVVSAGFAGRHAVRFDREFVNPQGTPHRGNGLVSSFNLSGSFKLDSTGPVPSSPDSGNAVDTALGTGWQTPAGLATTIGVGKDSGTIRLDLSFYVTNSVNAGNTHSLIHLQALKDGSPQGQEVEVSIPSTTTATQYTFEVPALNDPTGNAGTWTVQIREVTATNAIIRGTAGAPTVAFVYNELIPDHDAAAPDQVSIVPGHLGVEYAGAGDNWCAVSTWIIEDLNAGMAVMAYSRGSTFSWALIANAKVTSGVLAHEPGWVSFLSDQMHSGSSSSVAIPGDADATAALQGWRGVSQNTDVGGANPGGAALVTIGVSGITLENSGDVDHRKCFFRVNGTPAGNFTINRMESWGIGRHVVFGNKTALTVPNSSDLFPPGVSILNYTGIFGDWITILGSTSSAILTANDVATTFPTASSGFPPVPGDPSGSVNPTGYNAITPDTAGSFTASATEVERTEGGSAHGWGLADLLPNGGAGGVQANGLYNDHPFGGAGNPPTGFADSTPIDQAEQALASPRPILAKIGANGAGFRWAVNGSGLGFGVVADVGGRHVVTTGEKDPFDVDREDVVLRRIFDGGNTFSLAAADGAWGYSEPGYTPSFEEPSLVLDEEGNAYWLRPESGTRTLVKHAVDDGTRDFSHSFSHAVRQVVLEPEVPVYPSSVADRDRVPIFCYVTGDGAFTLTKLRLIAETQAVGPNASHRVTRYLAVAGTNLVSGPSGGVSATVVGGANVFDAGRTYAASVSLFGKHYFTDGRNILEYDPESNTVSALEASGRGELPKLPRLMTAWSGRLWFARTQDGNTTWWASAQGKPKEWDYFPPVPGAQDAVNGDSAAGPGRVPDAITALVPYDDAMLIIGCDSSIFVMRGDPLAGMRLDSTQGGRLDQLTDETGMAFGRSTTRDPAGAIYFFGQRGGVYKLSRDGVVRLTNYTIERRLQDINLATHRVELAWDYENEGLLLYVFEYPPQAPGGFNVVVTKTWTLTADFDGSDAESTTSYVNTNATVVADQVQLDASAGAVDLMYIPTPGRGSVMRVDPADGTILGEYQTAPDDRGRDPSRIGIDAEGNCWVGNRAEDVLGLKGSVTKIGFIEGGTRTDAAGTPDPNGEYVQNPTLTTGIDRDGDGLYRTANGGGSPAQLAWPAGTDSVRPIQEPGVPAFVVDAEDELVLVYKPTTGPNIRHIQPLADGTVWCFGFPFEPTFADRLNVSNGAYIEGVLTSGQCGGWSGSLDNSGNLWATDLRSGTDGRLMKMTPAGVLTTIDTVAQGALWSPSGIVIAASGRILTGGASTSGGFGLIAEYLNSNGALTDAWLITEAGPLTFMISDSLGDIWASSLTANEVYHIRLDHISGGYTLLHTLQTGDDPNGLSIDGNGKLWVLNQASSTTQRINTTTGVIELTVGLINAAFPYAASTFTRTVGSGSILSPGTWSVEYDGGVANVQWQTISWNGSVPGSAAFTVEARAASTQAGLALESFTAQTNGGAVGLSGQWVEIQCTFIKSRSPDASPILTDLTIQGATIDLPSATTSSFFWDSHNPGWWPDFYDDVAIQPTAVAVFDGDDPNDRVVALGFGGGEVRVVDKDADDDDGFTIKSDIWIGPMVGGLPDQEQRWGALHVVLARDRSGCSFEWYVSATPDIDLATILPTAAAASGTLTAGHNTIRYERARGLYVWLRLFNENAGESWAFESASMVAEPAGRARMRS